MLRKFWLIFAQVCTVCLAVLFVVSTLRPDLLPRVAGQQGNVVLLQETPTPVTAERSRAYADAAKKAMPAVVNIYTSKEMRQRSPLLDDPMLRRYFPDLADKRAAPARDQPRLGRHRPQRRLRAHQQPRHRGRRRHPARAGRRPAAARRASAAAIPESDLAVLKTEGENLPAITFGNLESVHVGDVVLAIGNPFGFGNTVTMGIVSALGRSHLGINRFEDFIQTDAAINPGNSGGALVDTAGNLIGINSTIFSQSGGSLGIGFAIPVSLARAVLEQIIKDGEVTRGWLGIEPQDITPEHGAGARARRRRRADPQRACKNGPADRAGMQVRDVVVEIDGKPTRDTPALLAPDRRAHAGQHEQGDRCWREQKPVDVDVTVGKRPKPRNSPSASCRKPYPAGLCPSPTAVAASRSRRRHR